MVRLGLVCCLPLAAATLLPSAPGTAPSQPLPFSHKQHAAEKIQCSVCHEMPGSGERAGLPSTELCMACHRQVKKESPAIRRLAEYHQKQEAVPWTRIYQLPDFVFFSHARHLKGVKGAVGCDTCHGPVEKRQLLWQEKPISMAACMDCHRLKRASIACHLCHIVK